MSNPDRPHRSPEIVHIPCDSGVALVCCDVSDVNVLSHTLSSSGDVTEHIAR